MTFIICVISIISIILILYFIRSILYLLDPFFHRMTADDLIAYNSYNKYTFMFKYHINTHNKKSDVIEKTKTLAILNIKKYIDSLDINDFILIKFLSNINKIKIRYMIHNHIEFYHTISNIVMCNEKISVSDFTHEIIHVLQRNFKNDYNNLLKHYGFIKLTNLKIKNIRNNPDNDNFIYSYKDIIFYSQYKEIPNYKDIDDIEINNINDIKFNNFKLSDHPNEIIAYYLTDKIINLTNRI